MGIAGIAGACGLWLVRDPLHRHHVIERYGLLNIIVSGEVLLSPPSCLVSFMRGILIGLGICNVVAHIVFCIWWLYFIEPDHLNSTQGIACFCGYGDIAIFLAGTLIAAGLGAHMDVLTDHSKIDLASANAYVGTRGCNLCAWSMRNTDHFGGFDGVALSR